MKVILKYIHFLSADAEVSFLAFVLQKKEKEK